jgi:alpha-tubulin suppressor-like RCC1 family protein
MAPDFVHVTSSVDGSRQSVGITASGKVFTWGRKNDMGQLGRVTTSSNDRKSPTLAKLDNTAKAVRGYAGGIGESGHTAVLDSRGHLWVAGCDRWQQLGLGSAAGGSSGYTWENGRIWREFFTRNDFIRELMDEKEGSSVRDVALGGDHTIVLSSNQKDVYTFGKGGEGQLGLVGKPFVSAPIRSTVLSSSYKDATIAAVCGIRDCSLTLDSSGDVLNKAGRCRMAGELKVALSACIERAERDGLLNK